MVDRQITDGMPLDATEVRFSTRSLLILMAAGAVLATALGAFIRQFPADVRPWLLVFWSLLAAFMAALVVFYAWRRRVAERKAGRALLRLDYVYFFLNQPAWVMYLASGLMLSIAPAMWVIGSLMIANRVPGAWGKLGSDMIYLLLLLANSLAITGAAITSFWWRRVRLCENGVVVRNSFLPWTNCKRWYWDADTKFVLMMEFSGYGTLAIKVAECSLATVEAIVNERIADKFYD